MVSASELRRGLEAERVIPRPGSAGLLGSWLESESPAEPRVTELPAFLRDVLQEPGASVVGGLLGSCYRKVPRFSRSVETFESKTANISCSPQTPLQNTFFTWLAVVAAGMEVEIMLVVFRLLFKLFMISLFFAFSKNSTNENKKKNRL